MYYNFHPDKIRLITINPLGRASSYFFQGLLDGHPNIVTLPDKIFNYGYEQIDSLSNSALTEYLWEKLQNSHKFVLGTSFSINNKAIFIASASNFVRDFGLSQKNVFLALYYAYAKTSGLDIQKIQYINYHPHLFKYAVKVLQDFYNFKTIFLIRDPRATYSSMKALKCLSPFGNSIQFVFLYKYFYGQLRDKFKDVVTIIRHEDLHGNYDKTRSNYLNFLNLPQHQCLYESTYFCKSYTGNNWYGKSNTGLHLSQPNPIYITMSWKESISKLEGYVINYTNKNILKENKYINYSPSCYSTESKSFDYYELWSSTINIYPLVLFFKYSKKIPVFRSIVLVFTLFSILLRDFIHIKIGTSVLLRNLILKN